LSRWYTYSHEFDVASVTGVRKLKPFGRAAIGRLLPRENEPEALLPRLADALTTQTSLR